MRCFGSADRKLERAEMQSKLAIRNKILQKSR